MMAKWSKQTYETVAAVLHETADRDNRDIAAFQAETFATLFKADNPNFDGERFAAAVLTGKGIRANILVKVLQARNDAAYWAYRADEQEPGYDHEDHA